MPGVRQHALSNSCGLIVLNETCCVTPVKRARVTSFISLTLLGASFDSEAVWQGFGDDDETEDLMDLHQGPAQHVRDPVYAACVYVFVVVVAVVLSVVVVAAAAAAAAACMCWSGSCLLLFWMLPLVKPLCHRRAA